MDRLRQFVIDLLKGLAWRFVRPRSRAGDGRVVALVHSFDGYKRFWKPVAFFTERALASTGVTTLYASEQVGMIDDPERCILTGGGDFVTRFERALDSVQAEYVLYLQKDIWITDELSAAQLDGYVELMQRHRLDCLKLGWASLWPDDHPAIVASTDPLPGDEAFGWFGAHDYSMGHHCSIFRTDFLAATLRHARLFRVADPLRQEQFTSRLLNADSKARNADDKGLRLAVWRDAPPVAYEHACAWGRITPEGQAALESFGITELYDESIPGDVFPKARYSD